MDRSMSGKLDAIPDRVSELAVAIDAPSQYLPTLASSDQQFASVGEGDRTPARC
jgi:hypothetical protein